MILTALALATVILWLVLRIGIPLVMFVIDLGTLALGLGTFSGRALGRELEDTRARQSAAAVERLERQGWVEEEMWPHFLSPNQIEKLRLDMELREQGLPPALDLSSWR